MPPVSDWPEVAKVVQKPIVGDWASETTFLARFIRQTRKEDWLLMIFWLLSALATSPTTRQIARAALDSGISGML